MYFDLLLILLPLFVGYFISVRKQQYVKIIHHSVAALVYIILLLMGMSLAKESNVFRDFSMIFGYAACFFAIIHICNLLALMMYDKHLPLPAYEKPEHVFSQWKMLVQSAQLVGVVIVGVGLGLLTKDYISIPDKSSTYALMVLLFLIGIQLRNSGIPLRQVLLNKRGMMIAILFVASSLLGGVISALILGLPINQGLAMASGFGWYTLSSIVINDALGAVMGSVALFNDLAREIIALMVIPMLMRRHPSAAVGIGGATSLDFTLPVIQKSGGLEMVPIAISFGFIVNVLSPILLVFFANY